MKKTYVTPDVEILDFANTACHPKTILSSNGEVISTECDSHGLSCPWGIGSNNNSGHSSSHNSNNHGFKGWFGGWFGWFGW